MQKIVALIPLLAMSLVLSPAAFAQGWDDAAAVNQAAQPAPQERPATANPYEQQSAARDQVLQQMRQQQEAQIQAIRQRTGQVGSDQERQFRLSNGMDGDEGYKEDGSTKWRMQMGPDGNMQVVQDQRGEMPDYSAGFGKFQPNGGKEQPDPRQMTTLTPEMVQELQKRAASNGPPGSPMYENANGSGFFGGMKAPTKEVHIDPSELKVHYDHGEPAWGKDKLNKVHKYVDGQEHYGNEDPHGFF